jgi:hypothetical protein
VPDISIEVDYQKVSLNKMLLYTGELMTLIQKYIIRDNPDKLKFLEHIYAERATSGIEIKHDWETVEHVVPHEGPYARFPNIATLNATLNAIIPELTLTQKMAIKCAYNCLMYAYSIHYSFNNEPINTLFLNPFFFPFHRAFILADGLHDLLTQRGKIAEFYSKLVKDKKYRNRKDLQEAVVHTSVKPDNTWCDKISQPYLTDWNNLTVTGGHTLLESLETQERLFANVILKQKKLYNSLANFVMVPADKKKISVVGNERGGGDEDDDVADEAEDNSFSPFDIEFSEKIKEIFGTQAGNNYGVLDCSGPKKTQFNKILRNDHDIDPSTKTISSIVSGTLDSSTNNDGPLSEHLFKIFELLGYRDRICIFLPEASMQNADAVRSIKEVMQRIIINPATDDDRRKMDMFFEVWSAPKDHCPNTFFQRSDIVVIEDDQKCPGVNETIEYIFNNHGLKSNSFLKQLASCCLFGIKGLSDKKLQTIENTNKFLDKYNQAFTDLELRTMNENGGCLFRVKTMGDFYRLADTALIQYLLPVGTQAQLGTCDGYNAANAFSSNNFPTIYGKPKTSFSCYSPIVLTPEELRQLEEQQRLADVEKQAQQLEDKKKAVKELIDNVYRLKEKLERADSKISKSLTKLTVWLNDNVLEKIDRLVKKTSVLINAIQTQIVDKTITDFLEGDLSDRSFSGKKKLFDANKIDWINTISILQINARNKIYTFFTLLLLKNTIETYKKTILANLEGKTLDGLKGDIERIVRPDDINSLDINFVNKFPGVTFLNTLNNYELVDTIEFLKEDDINTIITSLDIWFNIADMTVRPEKLYDKSTSKKIKLLSQTAYEKLVSYLKTLNELNKVDSNLTVYEYMLGLFLSSLNLDDKKIKYTIDHAPIIEKLFFPFPLQDHVYNLDILEQVLNFPLFLNRLIIPDITPALLQAEITNLPDTLSTTTADQNEIQRQDIGIINESIDKTIGNINNNFSSPVAEVQGGSQIGGAGKLDGFNNRILSDDIQDKLKTLYQGIKQVTIKSSIDLEVFNSNKLAFSINYINLVNMLEYVVDSILEYDYKHHKVQTDTSRKILSSFLNDLNYVVFCLSYNYYNISIGREILIDEAIINGKTIQPNDQDIQSIIVFDKNLYDLDNDRDLEIEIEDIVPGGQEEEDIAYQGEYIDVDDFPVDVPEPEPEPVTRKRSVEDEDEESGVPGGPRKIIKGKRRATIRTRPDREVPSFSNVGGGTRKHIHKRKKKRTRRLNKRLKKKLTKHKKKKAKKYTRRH